MCPIFVIKFSGVSDLQGVKVSDFPLTLLVIVTTVLRYRAACDDIETKGQETVVDISCQLNIKFKFSHPQKAHPWLKTRRLTY